MIEYLPGTPTTILDAIRRYWRYFAAGWVFPIYLVVASPWFDGTAGHPVASTLFLDLPFFAAYVPVVGLWMGRRIRYAHVLVLGILLPFGICTVAVFSRLAVEAWGLS